MDCLSENTVLEFVDGTLAADAAANVARHLDGCPSCRRLADVLGWVLSSHASRSVDPTVPDHAGVAKPSPLARGDCVGRYVVIEPIGAGGMSTVYLAHDPDLDRRVALKLVRADFADPAMREEVRARQLREAQALARLAHPNVIAVYDAGRVGDQVFIAMELIEGPTLWEWLWTGSRSWREIVAVFLKAGAGLAAAHAAGIVHRDFKPANVLVGADLAVRVLDFGLARLAARGGADAALGLDASAPLTQEGRVVGTPGYMPPEQRAGDEVDARADQFSYCVALHEALCGERPPRASGATPRPASAADIGRHAIRPRLTGPARLHRILQRGLRDDPAERYPSMAALLAELERCVTRRWRGPLLVAGLAIIFAVGGLAYRTQVQRERARCGWISGRLAGVWDAGRRAAVRAAFMASGRPGAAGAFDRVADRLDGHAAEWVAARAAACAGTRAAGPAAEMEALRAECLDWHVQTLRGFTDVLAQADGSVVDHSAQMADRLNRLDQCATGARLARRPRPPAEPAARAGVDAAHARVVKARVLAMAGKYRESEQEARAAAVAARASGFPPVEAEAYGFVGHALLQQWQLKPAEEALWHTIRLGESCGHGEPVAFAWADLAGLVGFMSKQSPDRLELAERYAQQAAAVVERLGGDTFLEGRAYYSLSAIARVRGHLRSAEERARTALKLLDQTAAGRWQLPAVQEVLALALSEQGRLGEALALEEQALAADVMRLGREHPNIARRMVEQGALLVDLGRHHEALEVAREAMLLARRTTPAQTLVAAEAMDVSGQALAALGRLDEALAHHREAQASFATTLGPEDQRVAIAREHVGTVLRLQGRPAAGGIEQERACAALERAVGTEHPRLASCLHELATTHLTRSQPDVALPLLERSLAVRERAGVRPADVAATCFALARALASLGRDRGQARSLATKARNAYATAEGDHREALTAVEQWLAGPGAR